MVPLIVLALAVWATGCEREVETVVIDAGCAPRTKDVDGGMSDAADDAETDAAETGDREVGAACNDDAECETGRCEGFEGRTICTTSCAPKENPCPVAELDCFENRCVPNNYCDDADMDGYGDGPGCKGRDCDDTASDVHPGAKEQCGNDVDDDCDGDIDEGSERLFYADEDGDGWGTDDSIRQIACEAPESFAAKNGDCDDNNPEINPGAEERCEPPETDFDCDGTFDDCR